MESPFVGTKFQVTATFKVVSTSAITATTPVDVTIRHPSTTEDSYQYPSSTQVVESSTGVYYIDVTPDVAGEWIVGFGSTGAVCAYNEVSVRVLPRRA